MAGTPHTIMTEKLFLLLDDISGRKLDSKTLDFRSYHYYKEIIRYWGQLNFIVKKTLRSLTLKIPRDPTSYGSLLYITFRILKEKASPELLRSELEITSLQKRFINKISTFSWNIALKGKSKSEILSIKQAVPNFTIKNLLKVMDFDFLKENLRFMNKSENPKASFTVNILNSEFSRFNSYNDFLDTLKKNSIHYTRDHELPVIFHVSKSSKKAGLIRKWHHQGLISFQDKASVAVVDVLSPQVGDLVCDLCAAPGIKTNLIAQFSRNRTKIVANDYSFNRMCLARKILSKIGIEIISLINSDGICPPFRLNGMFDKVLLDAPCTGSGAFLATPELKWRQNNKFLNQNLVLQEKLINSALALLKQDGILVYSVCSLYPEEGEKQITRVLDVLEPMKLPNWFSPGYSINGSKIPGTGRLFPSTHHTQGFFIAKFKKKAI